MVPEGLQELHVGLLEVEEVLLGSVAAAAAGSTAGWAVGWTFSLARPGGCEPGHWPWALHAAALCG